MFVGLPFCQGAIGAVAIDAVTRDILNRSYLNCPLPEGHTDKHASIGEHVGQTHKGEWEWVRYNDETHGTGRPGRCELNYCPCRRS